MRNEKTRLTWLLGCPDRSLDFMQSTLPSCELTERQTLWPGSQTITAFLPGSNGEIGLLPGSNTGCVRPFTPW